MEFITPLEEWDYMDEYMYIDDYNDNLIHSNTINHQIIDHEAFISSDHEDEGFIIAKVANNKPKPIHDDSFRLGIAFILISFGYMVPWTSLGSLISYYKYHYTANFYVKLYCCYYLPGFPVSLLQLRLDVPLDRYLGSWTTYYLRGILSYLVMILILISMFWITDRVAILILFTLLGVCAWLCHGTASMLASMYPSYAIASLQTGFRCPEIYTIVAVASLHMGKDPSPIDLQIFFISTGVCVFIGMISWLYVIHSPLTNKILDAKDLRLLSLTSYEKTPLISKEIDQNQPTVEATIVSTSPSGIEITPVYHQPLHNAKAKRLINVMEDINMKSKVSQDVVPLCLALYFTMFSSIFQASFFAYVDSKNDWDIEQVLYFVRLFSDLLGRPLTRLPRPHFLADKNKILHGALFRMLLMLVFFAYILIPSFPKSDVFIISYVAIFSILSGYFTVLIYEYASRDFTDKSSQAYAATQLNICFQFAAFSAVVLSVFITNTQWFEKFL